VQQLSSSLPEIQMSQEKTDFLAPYRDGEDSSDDNLLKKPPCGQKTTSQRISAPELQETSSNQRSDLADTFNLFKTYLDNKLESFKVELSSGNDTENITKAIKKDVSLKFRIEGNKIQYPCNADLLNDLHKLQKRVSDASSLGVIAGLITKITKRNKLIRIADKSLACWSRCVNMGVTIWPRTQKMRNVSVKLRTELCGLSMTNVVSSHIKSHRLPLLLQLTAVLLLVVIFVPSSAKKPLHMTSAINATSSGTGILPVQNCQNRATRAQTQPHSNSDKYVFFSCDSVCIVYAANYIF
jgi:hypothetical protein